MTSIFTMRQFQHNDKMTNTRKAVTENTPLYFVVANIVTEYLDRYDDDDEEIKGAFKKMSVILNDVFYWRINGNIRKRLRSNIEICGNHRGHIYYVKYVTRLKGEPINSYHLGTITTENGRFDLRAGGSNYQISGEYAGEDIKKIKKILKNDIPAYWIKQMRKNTADAIREIQSETYQDIYKNHLLFQNEL